MRIRTVWPRWSRALTGVTSSPVAADSHGKRAPSFSSRLAVSLAAGSLRTRYSSMARAAPGRVEAMTGRTKTSASQKTWPA